MKKVFTIGAAVTALAAAGFALASVTATKNVNITSTRFAPKTVTIAGGDTVQWKNVDTTAHQVVANNGSFASPQLAPGRTYAKRLDTPGTYNYHDALRPSLKGTVKVTGVAPSVSIGASVPIATFGQQVHVGGAINPAAVGDTVVVEAQPWGQLSFVEIGRVETAAAGVWDLVTTPQLLTSYKATWKGKTSATIMVAVSPKLSMTKVGKWFTTRAQAARPFTGRFVAIQRRNGFGQWVTLKKVRLNGQSAQRFRLLGLPRGRSLLRAFLTTNQAGSAYLFSYSKTLVTRRR